MLELLMNIQQAFAGFMPLMVAMHDTSFRMTFDPEGFAHYMVSRIVSQEK